MLRCGFKQELDPVEYSLSEIDTEHTGGRATGGRSTHAVDWAGAASEVQTMFCPPTVTRVTIPSASSASR